MFALESHLLKSIKHDNVLRAIQHGEAEVVAASAEGTMKQLNCGSAGPFAVRSK